MHPSVQLLLQKQLEVEEYVMPQQICSLFSKQSHEKRADILTNEELNTATEEPDVDTSAAYFDSKVSDFAVAFSPWEKDDWVNVFYNDLWYPGVVTDVGASLSLQGLFLEHYRN